MSLRMASGEAFATGAALYNYRPATSAETAPRIVLAVAVGAYETSAFVDTGGLYFICAPPFARRLRLDHGQGQPASDRIRWRGESLKGVLHRLPLTLLAGEGENVTIEVTAFVPRVGRHQEWNDQLPCVLGMQYCLERLRFAVDPEHDMFYFGEFGKAA
jgi:hypothetical protein